MLSCGHSASPIDSTRRRGLTSCVTVHWTNMRSIGPVLHFEAMAGTIIVGNCLTLTYSTCHRCYHRHRCYPCHRHQSTSVPCFRRIARRARSLVFCVSAFSSAARASSLVLGPERFALLCSKGQRGFRRVHEIPELPKSNIVRSEEGVPNVSRGTN